MFDTADQILRRLRVGDRFAAHGGHGASPLSVLGRLRQHAGCYIQLAGDKEDLR